MNKNYDKEFQSEIEKILHKLYHNPLDMGGLKIKRAVVITEKKYVDFLIENCLVTGSNNYGDNWALQLESKGYEVFEKYGNWSNYKKKVIDKKAKLEKAKNLSQKFWWIPIVMSFIALIISTLALFKK